ncbi:hypothetical protein [Endozoicomonas sp. 4G]|uniref:hypothetical protein n=1 Tax=Endozoicomonas sp. 4G TaxID=2872754 RepID=UPI002078F517|nr:hypothetical protein [Endozoicomonas sp. 4G]
MLSKNTLILILAVAVHCSNGQAQENRLPLLFVLGIETMLLPLFPVRDALPEPDSTVKAIAIEIFGDDILLKPLLKSDSRYCFFPATGDFPATADFPATGDFSDSDVKAKAYRRAASDDSADSEDSDSEDSDSEDSDSEDSNTSDENSDNPSNEDEADVETDVQCVNTAPNPFQALNEFSQYCATLRLNMINQGAISDSEIPAESEEVTEADSANHLEISSPAYNAGDMSHLKAHKQTHLPADQRPKRPKMHQCDHKGCNYITDHVGHLKRHKKTHLPADQRAKVHQCDHEGCNYRTDHTSHLKTHKRTHLPADQRPKVHQCGHEGCDYSTDHKGSLKAHKEIHLPADQRVKAHQCDHKGCNYRTDRRFSLQRHKLTHLPANQKLKRKAYDQPPSDRKRKKSDKE